MKKFDGFPARMDFTPLPNLFFSRLLPQITDMAELKVTLHVLAALYRKRGYPRFVTFTELLGDAGLMESLSGEVPPDEALRGALKLAAERGTVLHMVLDRDGASEDVYFLNDNPGRQAVAKIENGEVVLTGLKVKEPAYVAAGAPLDIFNLYEENIGMLTPMIADELREAEKLYPPDWIRDAIKEAVNQNKRKWSYISAILERWSAEGRSDGTYPRDSKKTGPDKYIKQRYGHMVRR
jgi:DnaD/phage-associated family protein